MFDHALDRHGFVHRHFDLNRALQWFRPLGDLGIDNGACTFDGFDDVLAQPLGDLQGHRGLAIIACRAGGIGEGASSLGDVTQAHHAVAVHLDRKVANLDRGLERPRHADRECRGFAFDRACCDELIVALDDLQQFRCGHIVAFHLQRVDDDFQHLIAMPGQLGFQHTAIGFQCFLQVLGQFDQCALRHLAGQRDDQHGELGQIDFVDCRLFGSVGKLDLGLIDLVADIRHDGLFVPVLFKLQQDASMSQRGDAGHLFKAVDAAQLSLQRLDQQAFAVRCRNARQRHGNIEHRHVNIG